MQVLKPQLIIMLSGLLLIAIGIALVCFQGYVEIVSSSQPMQQQQQLSANTSQFTITTRFPGLELVIIGAVLEIVGYLGVQPWKNPSQSSQNVS